MQQTNQTNSRKKALTLGAALLMIVLGGFLVITYVNPVQAQNLITQGTANVETNNYTPIAYPVDKNGEYRLEFEVNQGSIQVFFSPENTTIGHWSNGTEFDLRTLQNPLIDESKGTFTGGFYGGNPSTKYYILSNTDAYSKNVSYDIYYTWNYTNYIAIIAGIALALAGTVLIVLTLVRGKQKEINKPIENQQ